MNIQYIWKRAAQLVCLLIVATSLFRCSVGRSTSNYATLTFCADTAAVLSMDAYGKLSETHRRPYVYEHGSNSGGAVLMYGAEHTRDPKNAQVEDIHARWREFKPTVALVEGRLGFLLRPFMNPVKVYGESGWVAFLARRDDVPVFSWEPPTDAVNQALLNRYTPEQLALSRILNPYFSNLRYGRPKSPEAYVEDVLDRAAEFGVQDKFKSSEDVDRYWKIYFPQGPDWREVSDQWGLPGYLGEISDTRNGVRNAHLTCILLDLANRGERAFVVAGSSHAVCVEPALEVRLKK